MTCRPPPRPSRGNVCLQRGRALRGPGRGMTWTSLMGKTVAGYKFSYCGVHCCRRRCRPVSMYGRYVFARLQSTLVRCTEEPHVCLHTLVRCTTHCTRVLRRTLSPCVESRIVEFICIYLRVGTILEYIQEWYLKVSVGARTRPPFPAQMPGKGGRVHGRDA